MPEALQAKTPNPGRQSPPQIKKVANKIVVLEWHGKLYWNCWALEAFGILRQFREILKQIKSSAAGKTSVLGYVLCSAASDPYAPREFPLSGSVSTFLGWNLFLKPQTDTYPGVEPWPLRRAVSHPQYARTRESAAGTLREPHAAAPDPRSVVL